MIAKYTSLPQNLARVHCTASLQSSLSINYNRCSPLKPQYIFLFWQTIYLFSHLLPWFIIPFFHLLSNLRPHSSLEFRLSGNIWNILLFLALGCIFCFNLNHILFIYHKYFNMQSWLAGKKCLHVSNIFENEMVFIVSNPLSLYVNFTDIVWNSITKYWKNFAAYANTLFLANPYLILYSKSD